MRVLCNFLIAFLLKSLVNSEKNDFNFNNLIEPTNNLNCGDGTFLLIYVHSSPENYKNRLKIRQTWGNINKYVPNDLKLLFTTGLSSESLVNDKLKLESSIYNDIIQYDYSDTYRNLTIKAVMTLKWISKSCKNVKYILKVDDDVYVNYEPLMQHLRVRFDEEKDDVNTIMCFVHKKMKVIRNRNSKWYLSKEEFARNYFSKYCSGSAYVLTGDLAKKISHTSKKVNFFWIDDYFITGIMTQILKINLVEFNSVYVLKTTKSKEMLASNKHNFIFAHVGHSKNSLDFFGFLDYF
ncbi:unnamed protein product [Brachionus calyciflorus]|uniref:Hexosyltransferase n=1 Tax=Brachionus calyciflorus TaxID=104777 RepID=A0A813PZA5_9BILA|nr:unnamed protein product [Brachionus calyciflorus]